MNLNVLNFIGFVKELVCDNSKFAKFKEIVDDIKELISDIKDVMSLCKNP